MDAKHNVATAPTVSYQLWRQDDNGGSFWIADFTTEAQAIEAQKQYEAKGHKQIYWVETKLEDNAG